MKSLMLLLRMVLQDMESWCCTSTTRDLKTITSRVENEGISFLTITLANFGKGFEKSLDQGFVDSSDFVGFHFSQGLPAFLQGFLSRVFDSSSGRLIDEPSVDCIHAVRQLTLMFSKINLPCSPAREAAAFKGFVDVEREVRKTDANTSSDQMEDLLRVGTLLWADILNSCDLAVHEERVIPKHGPGATSDRLRGNAKWKQREWPERLDRVFPAGEFLLPSWRYNQYLSRVHYPDPGTERPVKVISVPKTLKTPRIIAIEPTCMQYVQQGLLAEIWEGLLRSDTRRSLIGWGSQVPNQHLARKGSEDGTLATLDLKEASDRVSNQHVRHLLSRHGSFAEAVDACRSRKASVPGYGVKRLAKFASMGSALTFPIESMYFCTLVFIGIERALGRPLTNKDIKSFVGKVRVYGDDIIVPVEFVHSVIEVLETFGARVNSSKSFWTGKFRESCGKEYYNGSDVSIVRMRSMLPTHRKHSQEIVQTIEFRNHLYRAGMWNSARYLDEVLESLSVPMPRVLETSPVLGRYSFLGYETQKSCERLHRPLVKGLVVAPIIPASPLDDVPALVKVLTKRGEMPNPDVRHLSYAGRPRTVNTKTRWAPPY